MHGRLNVTLAVIARAHDALDDVVRCLKQAGARVYVVLHLEQATLVAEGADAAVLFADDYPLDRTLEVVTQLSVNLVIVVTADASAFRASMAQGPQRSRVLILPRQGWHLTLVAAIRRGLPVRIGEA
jgi:hypothetical protein